MSRRPSYPTAAASHRPINANPEGVVHSPIGNNANAYPQVLDPEHGPQTVHRSDLFFANSNPHMNTRQNPAFSQRSSDNAPSPSVSNQLYPYHQQAFHHYSPLAPPPAPPPTRELYSQYQPPPPSYPQNPTNAPLVPALPPKPIAYPPINTTTNYDQYAGRPPASLPPPSLPPPPPPPPLEEEEEETILSPTDDSNELAMALALSQSESLEHQKLQEQLRNQEEEDLARALAESMLSTGSNITPSVNPFFTPVPDAVTSLPKTRAEDIPQVTTPPAPILVDLPAQSASSPGGTPNPPPSDKPFPEFGLHEKWRLPGVSDKVVDGSHPSNRGSEQMGRKPSTNSSTTSALEVPRAGARTRSLSISSVSSLAYMQPEPEPESTDSRDKADSQDSHEIQDGRATPEALDAANPEPISKTITPTPPDLSLIIPEELEEPNVLVFDDEAYARQLAAEEEALAAQEALYPIEKARPMPMYDRELEQALPLYTPQNQHYNGVEDPSSSKHSYFDRQPLYPSNLGSYNGISSTPTSVYSSQSHASQHPEHPQPFYGRKPSDATDFKPTPPLSNPTQPAVPYSPVVYPSLRKRRDTESDTFSDTSHHSSNHSAATAPPALPPGAQHPSPPSFNEARSPANAVSMPSPGVLNANHFLDRELLLGVSIGFKPPPISTTHRPMEDPMPNIISLPYARCPPLHLQAPTWSHLLRLMARLSGTRIEPTVEAMAVTKAELKLRTVVQFIKPAPQSNDWRTIVWFTIDHPVPPTVPGAARYTSGNPNLLPWSYTLSPIPILLRDATDTNISKTYTIPASDSVPLPTLPITFPSLASYLQVALEASRQHSGDSSSGLGKLGKTVQMCYPNVGQGGLSEFDIPERSSVTHLFKRVIGRSNNNKKKGKTSNNEETYQLVTPFVPDEWG